MAFGRSNLSKIVCIECSVKIEKVRRKRFCYIFTFGLLIALIFIAIMITIVVLDGIFQDEDEKEDS